MNLARTRSWSAVALASAGLIVALSSCGSPKRIPLTPGSPSSASYTLSCPSFAGALTTNLTYSVTASLDPAPSGSVVSFSIDAPIAQVDSPISVTFVSSSTTFNVPAGFAATSVSTNPESNADFSSSSAVLDGGLVTLNLAGSFPIDGTPRPVPALVVTGTITGAAGTSVVWATPIAVDGTANAGAFLGNQSSSCSIESPGPIGTTSVDMAQE